MRGERHIEIVKEFPAYWLYDRCIVGNFAYTTPDKRMILDEYAISYNDKVETPGHHFNTMVKDIRFPKKTVYHDALSYPYFAKPGKYPHGVYVDIRQAYYQIASRYGLECSHREGRYMAFGVTKPPSIMQENKLIRALLVSGTYKRSHMTEWKNHELTSRYFPNHNYAPFLQRAIIGTLHSILSLCSPYAVYGHTDGFILPHWNAGRVFRELDARGIQYSIKGSGPCEIYGVGSYRIGDKRTRIFLRSTHATNGVNHGIRDWWLTQWERSLSVL